MKISKISIAVLVAAAVLSLSGDHVYAQSIGVGAVNAKLTIGTISSFGDLVRFMINWTIYIGWVGAVFGVGGAIAAIIYKSLGSDSDETVKNFQGYMTKAVLVIVAGILLACFGYLIKIIVGFIPGLNAPTDLNTAVGDGTAEVSNPFGE